MEEQHDSRTSFVRILERYVAKFEPHTALKFIALSKSTFDERAVPHRVGRMHSAVSAVGVLEPHVAHCRSPVPSDVYGRAAAGQIGRFLRENIQKSRVICTEKLLCGVTDISWHE